MTDCKKYMGAIFGLITGDALGVPAEFKPRSMMKRNPVTDMEGYGTHNQPAGTWSDDSSMVLATMEWLGEFLKNDLNYSLLMEKFQCWLWEGAYTPYGDAFDYGATTIRALMNYSIRRKPLLCGGKGERDNGNGSLMRILPAALWCGELLHKDDMKGSEFIYDLSSLTHGHLRSKMGCLIYSKMIADLLWAESNDKMELVQKSLDTCRNYFGSEEDKQTASEMERYGRLWKAAEFQKLPEKEIHSSGYVVHTLEAALWCFLNTDNYKDCVLKAVNLGDDTDTVAAVAGGLAGVYYGIDAIPEEWVNLLPKKEWIETLAKKMIL